MIAVQVKAAIKNRRLPGLVSGLLGEGGEMRFIVISLKINQVKEFFGTLISSGTFIFIRGRLDRHEFLL